MDFRCHCHLAEYRTMPLNPVTAPGYFKGEESLPIIVTTVVAL